MGERRSYPVTGRRSTQRNHRIVYAVAADTLNVLLVGKRNDDEIYRQLRRMVG